MTGEGVCGIVEPMAWNHRIVKYLNGSGYGLHEVYYDEDGVEASMTVDPIEISAETPDELRDLLKLALDDATNQPVFDEPSEWNKAGAG